MPDPKQTARAPASPAEPSILERFGNAVEGTIERATGYDVPDTMEELRNSLPSLPNLPDIHIPTPQEALDGLKGAWDRGVELFEIHVARPFDVAINSSFSSGRRPNHGGIDMATRPGTPVGAVADGRAIMVRDTRFGNQSSTYGNVTAFDHCNGNFITVNAHALNGSITVRPGETVRAGQEFMGVGSTGRSTGPHLHFETWVRGRDNLLYRVNPELVLNNQLNMHDENVREQLIRQTMDDFGKTRAQLRPLMSDMVEDCLRRNGTYDPQENLRTAEAAPNRSTEFGLGGQ